MCLGNLNVVCVACFQYNYFVRKCFTPWKNNNQDTKKNYFLDRPIADYGLYPLVHAHLIVSWFSVCVHTQHKVS